MGYELIRRVMTRLLLLCIHQSLGKDLSISSNQSTTLYNTTADTYPWSGIYCDGSFWCGEGHIFTTPHELADLNKYILTIPDHPTWVYATGAHIACKIAFPGHPPLTPTGFWCIFAQGDIHAGGISGRLAKRKVQELLDHGCRRCGNVPLLDDDPEYGVLTSDFVERSDCVDRLCPPTQIIGEQPEVETVS